LQAYFTEALFVRLKMASEVQDGSQELKWRGFGFGKLLSILFSAISFYFDQEHDPKSYFVILAKCGVSIQNGGSKSNFLS
jgi:hypothetical protein